MGNDYECHSGNPERPPVHEVRGTSKGVAKGLDAWVHEYNTKYNTDRPHQSIGGCTPAERFTAGQPDPDPALDLTALPNGAAAATARIGSPDGSPPTASSVRHGSKSASANTDTAELVDVHVTDRLLEFWSGNDRLRTVVRESKRRSPQEAGCQARHVLPTVKKQPSTKRKPSTET